MCFLPANICLFKVKNRITRKRYEICLKIAIKTPERRYWRLWIYFTTFLVFLLLTWNKWMLAGLLIHECFTTIHKKCVKQMPKKASIPLCLLLLQGKLQPKSESMTKPVMETPKKMKSNMFKVNNKNIREASITSFWRLYC